MSLAKRFLENIEKVIDAPNAFDSKKLDVRCDCRKEWHEEDFADFLSDFAGVSDEATIGQKGKEIYAGKIADGWSEITAGDYADGYEQALLDILNQK